MERLVLEAVAELSVREALLGHRFEEVKHPRIRGRFRKVEPSSVLYLGRQAVGLPVGGSFQIKGSGVVVKKAAHAYEVHHPTGGLHERVQGADQKHITSAAATAMRLHKKIRGEAW